MVGTRTSPLPPSSSNRRSGGGGGGAQRNAGADGGPVRYLPRSPVDATTPMAIADDDGGVVERVQSTTTPVRDTARQRVHTSDDDGSSNNNGGLADAMRAVALGGSGNHSDGGGGGGQHPPQRHHPQSRQQQRAHTNDAAATTSNLVEYRGNGAFVRNNNNDTHQDDADEYDDDDDDDNADAEDQPLPPSDGGALYASTKIEPDSQFTPFQLMRLLDSAMYHWTAPADASRRLEWANARFGLDVNNQSVQFVELEKCVMDSMNKANVLYQQCQRVQLVGNETNETLRNESTFARLLEAIWQTHWQVDSDRRLVNATRQTLDNHHSPYSAMFRFSTYVSNATTTMTPYQNLLLWVLRRLADYNLARYRGRCYKQIRSTLQRRVRDADGAYAIDPATGRALKTPTSYDTHAWEVAYDIDRFVHRVCKKEVSYQQWLNMTASRGSVKQLVDYLLISDDPEFPDLKPDRHVFAFMNGVYDAKAMTFFPFGAAAGQSSLARDTVACNYFALMFPHQKMHVYDWYTDIATPHFQSILDYQRFGYAQRPTDELQPFERLEREKVSRTFYVHFGRLMYDVGEMDGWQVGLFVKGIGGSGKSTMGKHASAFYNPADVAALSSNMEEKFGLSAIIDKFLFVCFEVKQKFGLNQADVQSMISGETVTINTKFKTAESRRWTVPGLWLGNEVANWIDSQMSMTRRLLLAEFLRRVAEADGSLDVKLHGEMAHFILKCNLAYRTAVAAYGAGDVWKNLPNYFHQTRSRLSAQINPLVGFLHDVEVWEINPDRFVRMSAFKDSFRAWLEANKYPSNTPFNPDTYEAVFESLRMRVSYERRTWRQTDLDAHYIIGIGYRDIDANGGADSNPCGGAPAPPRPASNGGSVGMMMGGGANERR